MKHQLRAIPLGLCTCLLLINSLLTACVPGAGQTDPSGSIGATRTVPATLPVQLGPRPFYLVDQLEPSALKTQLAACAASRQRYAPSQFSISHRGAPLQFPEHTAQSYQAAARMGAGTIECDVTFTKDHALVCRHSQCDLHETTNILSTPLARTCREPFRGATNDSPASAQCCTSDLTLAEFKSLRGSMEGVDPQATTIEAFQAGTPAFRTNLYTDGGTLLSHQESIELITTLGANMTPELKRPMVAMPHNGLDRVAYAQQLVDEYRNAGIPPEQVQLQSFDIEDHKIWLDYAPEFAARAILLDGRDPNTLAVTPPTLESLQQLKALGVNNLAPRMASLLKVDPVSGALVASEYARRANAAGLKLIAWTLERSGRIRHEVQAAQGQGFYATTWQQLANDGAILRTIDALVNQANVVGIFSDWPATTTFYANCTNLDSPNLEH